jgi:hypothetical protein
VSFFLTSEWENQIHQIAGISIKFLCALCRAKSLSNPTELLEFSLNLSKRFASKLRNCIHQTAITRFNIG